ADPYRVWLSEIMLQQTTVVAVAGYFRRFVDRWPTVGDLAAAPVDDVLAAWAGLGYYARARNLHACARAVVERHGGRFPDTAEGLRALPGIGAYTAGAIAAIAFGRRAAAVDGNVERVVSRIHAVEEPLPAAKKRIAALTEALVPADRPGDFAQALMDLGATVCVPRNPRCVLCPWRDACEARRQGIQEGLPRKAAKAERPTRRGYAYWLVNPEGAVLLRRRPPRGLLGGMLEIPSSDWAAELPADPAAAAPLAAQWRALPGIARHGFTHFELELTVLTGQAGAAWRQAAGEWVAVDRLGEAGLPSVMMKVVRHALAQI
ncbi:MAG TPA: A/G-specific adenine glycosylase, partial [Alphaproteobacteria bacterium]|nr:A/G-specific adenine glycosylase [Alphaproteobacteria bacterium]